MNIYILDRRPVTLSVAGVPQSIGSLRRFWKITELDEERADELSASEAVMAERPSPKAAMVADIVEMPLGNATVPEVRAHPVIGWDDGRTRVTDMGWDFLPVLGYAVREPHSDMFVRHRQLVGDGIGKSHDRLDDSDRQGDYAAIATPATSAHVVNAWLRAIRNFDAVSWLGWREKTLAT